LQPSKFLKIGMLRLVKKKLV